MYVSSVPSHHSPLFPRLSVQIIPNTLLRLHCNRKPVTQIKGDLSVSATEISSSVQSVEYLPSVTCGSSSNNSRRSFTLEDIITSCGLPDDVRVRCQSSKNPDCVLSLLLDSGFSRSQVTTIVSKYPKILLCDAGQILKPKIDFLLSVFLSQSEFLYVFMACPQVFKRSLKNHLVPLFDFLTASLGSQRNAIEFIKSYPYLLYMSSKHLRPNLSTWQSLGIPQSSFSRLTKSYRVIRAMSYTQPCRFNEVVSTSVEMGFDPWSTKFGIAVVSMSCFTKSNWEKKLVFYKTMGFSNKEILNMFRLQPYLMVRSEEVIRGTVEFYARKFLWSPSQLSRNPRILAYKLEERIIPRCLVMQILLSTNRIAHNMKVSTILAVGESCFLQKYVIKYKDEIPEVLDAYQGMIESAECDSYWEELRSQSKFEMLI